MPDRTSRQPTEDADERLSLFAGGGLVLGAVFGTAAGMFLDSIGRGAAFGAMAGLLLGASLGVLLERARPE